MNVLGRLWHYVRRYKGRLVLGIVFGMFSAVLNVASLPTIRGIFEAFFNKRGPESFRGVVRVLPLGPMRAPLERAVETLVSMDPFHALFIVLGMLVVLKVFQGFFKALQEYNTCYVATHSAIDIAKALYRNVMGLPVAFFGRERNSQVMSRFTNDMANVERGLDTLFGKTIREPLYLAGYLIYCLCLSPGLTLISFVVMPFVAFGVVLLAKKARRGSRKALQSRARMMGLLSESLAGVRVVKVFDGADYEQQRFGAENERLFRQTMKVVKAEATTGPLVEFFLFLGGTLVIITSGYYVIHGSLSPDGVMTLFAALMMALDPLRKLANVGTRYQQTKSGAERIFEYMDAETEKLDAPGAWTVETLAEGIRFEHVSFKYDADQVVLEDVSFEVKRGEVIAVVGISGAGKTTLVNLLPRFYDPTAGRILLDGRDIAEAGLRSLRAQIGLVTQDVVLFDDTVTANIAYGIDAPDMDRVKAAAEAAHADAFIDELPDGYDTVIGEGGMSLSGGQRQRLTIARAIYRDPAILILDEATSSLDTKSEALIQDALAKFMAGRTTFVIAHRLATIEHADRVIVLDRGRIEAIGTHAELIDADGVYRALYQRQFRDAPEDAAEKPTET